MATLPYFGELDLEDDFFEVDIELNEKELSISIDFEGETPKKKQLQEVEQFLKSLLDIDKRAKEAIIADYENNSGFVYDYIDSFYDSLEGSGDYDDFIDKTDTEKTPDEQLLAQLYVNNIGIYPNGNTYSVFDYIIDDEQTDDILVVYVTGDGEIDGFTIES